MSKITYLDGRDAMIDALERHLADIRAGKVDYLAVITEMRDGEVRFSWSGKDHEVPARRMIGTFEVMKALLVKDLERVNADSE